MWLEDGAQKGPLPADALIKQLQQHDHLHDFLLGLTGRPSQLVKPQLNEDTTRASMLASSFSVTPSGCCRDIARVDASPH